MCSHAQNENEALADVYNEVGALLQWDDDRGVTDDAQRRSKRKAALLTTTLVAFDPATCGAWASDFKAFDSFVQRAGSDVTLDVSLVAFHPHFDRWRDRTAPSAGSGRLTPGCHIGAYRLEALVDPAAMAAAEEAAAAASGGRGHGGGGGGSEGEGGVEVECSFRRGDEVHPAVVLDCDETALGVRTVRLRFLDGEEGGEEGREGGAEGRGAGRGQGGGGDNGDYGLGNGRGRDEDDGEDDVEDVPADWICLPGPADAPLLADNRLHRSPVPLIHILRSDVLAAESERAGDQALFELQWRNARAMRREQGPL
jgi:hypothetical protein